MGFIDDEENIATFADQVLESRAKLRQKTHKAEGGFNLKGEEDFVVEGSDAEERVGEIDEGVDVVVEGLGKGAGGGGFAGTDIAGEEGSRVVLESKGEASLGLAVSAGGVKVLGGDRLGERGLQKAVEFM